MRLRPRIILATALVGGILLSVPAAAQSGRGLADPGPVWAGITDTTSLGLRVDAHVAEAERLLDAVRAVRGARSAENTLLPFKRAQHELGKAQQLTQIALNAHPDSAFRAYARARDALLDERSSALAVDRAIYDALAALDADPLSAVDADGLTPALRYVLDQDLESYRRGGIALDAPARARIADLRARIAEVGTRFEQNIHSDIRSITVSPDSLGGLPPDFAAALASGPTDDAGRLVIAITPNLFAPLAIYAENADLRQRAARAFLDRGNPQNIP